MVETMEALQHNLPESFQSDSILLDRLLSACKGAPMLLMATKVHHDESEELVGDIKASLTAQRYHRIKPDLERVLWLHWSLILLTEIYGATFGQENATKGLFKHRTELTGSKSRIILLLQVAEARIHIVEGEEQESQGRYGRNFGNYRNNRRALQQDPGLRVYLTGLLVGTENDQDEDSDYNAEPAFKTKKNPQLKNRTVRSTNSWRHSSPPGRMTANMNTASRTRLTKPSLPIPQARRPT